MHLPDVNPSLSYTVRWEKAPLRWPVLLSIGYRGIFIVHGSECEKLLRRLLSVCITSNPEPQSAWALECDLDYGVS